MDNVYFTYTQSDTLIRIYNAVNPQDTYVNTLNTVYISGVTTQANVLIHATGKQEPLLGCFLMIILQEYL